MGEGGVKHLSYPADLLFSGPGRLTGAERLPQLQLWVGLVYAIYQGAKERRNRQSFIRVNCLLFQKFLTVLNILFLCLCLHLCASVFV